MLQEEWQAPSGPRSSNSGKRGAEKATGVLKDAGISPDSIYTVEGGAEALGKESGALATDRSEEAIDWKYVSGKEAVEAVGNDDIQIVDVRDNEAYAEGHLEGSYQVSLKDAGFDPNNLFIIEEGAKGADVAAAFVK